MDLHELSVRRRKLEEKSSTVKDNKEEEESLELKGYSIDEQYLKKQETEAVKSEPEKTIKKYEENIDMQVNAGGEEGFLEEGKQIDI